ncbi:MAG: AraC family transcriptional regulator [Bacteroidetes bacterium]|uniref:AraC family transcriptional regulator n=1 Tax=Candidatus Cryptobacteroides faecavium TaxID=2840762 RepID=A0A9D9IHA6_9BACT|nr:AraC family transcriptional regulator [Candidatus Cryptobacteroides faecavium]
MATAFERNNILCYPGSGPDDEKWGMTVTTAGKQSIPPGGGYPLSSHPSGYLFSAQKGRTLDEYQIVYISEGSGKFASASCPMTEITAGTAILLFPGEWHTYRPSAETGWDEYWVGFRSRYMDMQVENKFFSASDPVWKIGISSGIISLYEEVISVISSERLGFRQLVSGIVMHILGSIYYKGKNIARPDSGMSEKISEAKVLMKDTDCPLTIEQIAGSVGMGYSKFRKLFKDYTGTSPAQYRLQQKLAKAKELLTTSQMNISEIAYFLKFDSPGQFSIFFRQKEGTSPRKFREKYTGH